MASGHRVSLDALQEAMFSGPLEVDRLQRIFARMQPESRRALLDMSGLGLPQPWRAPRIPTLVLGAQRDMLIPVAYAASSARMLGADYRLVEGLGHAVMLESGWRGAASAVLDWLDARNLAAGRAAVRR